MKNDISLKNIKVFTKNPCFNTSPLLSYEKYFTRGDLQIIEYYSNHELDSYFETERTKHFIITKGYSAKGDMFSTNVTYLNELGKPYIEYDEVINIDKTITSGYRKINSKKEYSLQAFDTFLEALNYKPHIL